MSNCWRKPSASPKYTPLTIPTPAPMRPQLLFLYFESILSPKIHSWWEKSLQKLMLLTKLLFELESIKTCLGRKIWWLWSRWDYQGSWCTFAPMKIWRTRWVDKWGYWKLFTIQCTSVLSCTSCTLDHYFDNCKWAAQWWNKWRRWLTWRWKTRTLGNGICRQSIQ